MNLLLSAINMTECTLPKLGPHLWETNQLQISKIDPLAKLPTRATTQSCGWDLYSLPTFEYMLHPGKNVKIPTGIAMRPPPGCFVQIYSRSGLASKFKLHVPTGTIDPDYTGEISILLHNFGDNSFKIEGGHRLAQFVIHKYEPNIQLTVVPFLRSTIRGSGGFGSSGFQ